MSPPRGRHAPHTPCLIPEVLAEYGELTLGALRGYLPSGEPREYLYNLISDYPQRPGKMMRSSLCLATARAFGAPIEDALLSAVSIELLHNALLIHDDIEDGSEERRGKPTLHALHGIPLAINAGDGLCLASMRPLMDNLGRLGPHLALRILRETERMAWESAEGQAMELGWRRDNISDLTDSDYLTMVLKKTCWLAVIHPSRVGALIGARGRVDLDPFVRFGFFLGAAFQIQDDLLNLIDDPRYGKEINGDLWEGKRTLMLNHLTQRATVVERTRLATIMNRDREDRTIEEIDWIRERMQHYNSLEYACGIAHGLAGAALHEFDEIYSALPNSRDKQFIRGLVTWVFERTSR